VKSNPASVAIVGMACVYPDARSPMELWENVLAQRRAFRRLPPERLRLEDYYSTDATTPDATYSTEAALIEGYEFDRVKFRVAGGTYRCADLAHWLALDVASRALADAGFPDGHGLPNASTGVLLGNSLTGEFSRANALRLRWPYVRRVLDAALARRDWAPAQRSDFLAGMEAEYKAPFPPVGEETLAGRTFKSGTVGIQSGNRNQQALPTKAHPTRAASQFHSTPTMGRAVWIMSASIVPRPFASMNCLCPGI